MSLTVRHIQSSDHVDWDALYQAYAEFYEVEQTPDMRDRVWGWMMDPTHEVCGFCAVVDGALIGIAHCRPFARPLAAASGVYLDDLFVTPAARGTGAAGGLIDAVRAKAADEGHSIVRWITAEDNLRARGLYDKIATATGWVTYDMAVLAD